MIRYRLFGLLIDSAIALPELAVADGCGTADVVIRLGGRQQGTVEGLEAAGDGLRLTIPEIADYELRGGSEIVVHPHEGVPERNLRLYLLGSAMGVLIHQRGLLPLHANAVEIGGRAIAFMGASGEGKSTLAAWLHDRGHRVIADDVCALDCRGEGAPQVHAGIPRLRLWRDALEASGRNPGAFELSYRGDPAYEKYDVPLASPAPQQPLPLAAVYLLESGGEARVSPLSGVAAAEAVFAHTYRGAYLGMTPNAPAHWQASLNLIRRVPVFRAERRWSTADFPEDAAMLLAHARRVAADVSAVAD